MYIHQKQSNKHEKELDLEITLELLTSHSRVTQNTERAVIDYGVRFRLCSTSEAMKASIWHFIQFLTEKLPHRRPHT